MTTVQDMQDMTNVTNFNMGRPDFTGTDGPTTSTATETTSTATETTSTATETIGTSNEVSTSERPFTKAIVSYRVILDNAILEAINQLTQNSNKFRYARVRLGLFTDVVEVECGDSGNFESKDPENKTKTYSYPLHKLHYGPINKAYTESMVFLANASPDYVKASKFCYRDWMIWTKVNADGKNPGGNGFGYGGTACSPFRDVQIDLRDKGYYLQDLSQYVFDKTKNKWYYNIDIRLYQDKNAVRPKSLWHQYGMIPGLGYVDGQNTGYTSYTSYNHRNYQNRNKRNVNHNNYDHGDMNLNKVVPKAGNNNGDLDQVETKNDNVDRNGLTNDVDLELGNVDTNENTSTEPSTNVDFPELK